MPDNFVPLDALRVSDRTRTVTDWTCKRERFYLTEYGGTGIVSIKGKTELDYGTTIHDALAELARWVGGMDVIGGLAPAAGHKILQRETLALGSDGARQLAAVGEGSLRGFAKVVWPTLLQHFDIVAVEVEVEVRLTDWLRFMAKPDLILRNKHDGTYWYFEYKTTGQRVEDWLKQWPRAVQVHSAILAVEQTTGLRLEGCIIQGLAKGYRDYKGNQRSPFCEGWRFLNGPIAYSHTYMRNKGWEKFSSWDYPDGGVAGWVETMPEDLLLEQFPRTQPIFLRRDLAERFFNQLVVRETEIRNAVQKIRDITEDVNHPDADAAVQAVMDSAFPMAFSQCTGRYGKYDCPMLEACWNSRVNSDPLASGLYKRREPHHLPERELFDAKGLGDASDTHSRPA